MIHSMPLSVLIADDHAIARAGLRVLVERQDGIEPIAEAAKAQEAVVAETDLDKKKEAGASHQWLIVNWPNLQQPASPIRLAEAVRDERVDAGFRDRDVELGAAAGGTTLNLVPQRVDQAFSQAL